MEKNKKSKYFITEHYHSDVKCDECDGKGIKKRHFRKMVFTYECDACKGTGVKSILVRKEIPLEEALKLLNDEKTI